MKNEFPEIFKNKVNKLKNNVQKEYYYHNKEEVLLKENNIEKVDKLTLINKINNIFLRPDYIYQADITIMYKNGENINKKIVGIKDNYLLTFEGEKIYIDEIYDIK